MMYICGTSIETGASRRSVCTARKRFCEGADFLPLPGLKNSMKGYPGFHRSPENPYNVFPSQVGPDLPDVLYLID